MATPYSFSTPEAHARFVEDFTTDKVFTSSHFPNAERPDVTLNVFRSVLACVKSGGFRLPNGEADIGAVGGMFQYLDQAAGTVTSPATGITYPVFTTCYVVRLEEWLAMGKHLTALGAVGPGRVRVSAVVLPGRRRGGN